VKERSNILKVIERHVLRVLPCDWHRSIKDYRYRKNTEWNLKYVLEVLMAGALTGCKTLREVETLSEVYGGYRIPDTTLHDIMIRLDPEGLRQELARGVKQALREHELPKDFFPVRITAIDGKYNYNTEQPVNAGSEVIEGGGEGKLFRHMALRAFSVSSETKLYLGQREILSKGAEVRNLVPFLDDLQALYGRTKLLEVISIDAGMVSKDNADQIVQRGLKYIMALKGGQVRLCELAEKLFIPSQHPTHTEHERCNGKEISRKLYRCTPETVSGWEHLCELWKVETEIYNNSSQEVTRETRCFMTNLPPATLSDEQVLQAVRMHWGIENNGNWCFDVHWQEDTAPWTSRAMVLVSYLRMMAYNIVSRLRTRKFKAQNNRAMGWKDLFRYFEHALCRLRLTVEATGKAYPVFL